MKKLTLLILLIFAGLYLKAREDNCSEKSGAWKSEKEVIKYIDNTIFKTSESVEPDEGSWMTSANFYTCDDEFGYLIIKCDKKPLVHQHVPTAVWNALKNAKSIGGYYNFYLRDKYKLDKKSSKSPVL